MAITTPFVNLFGAISNTPTFAAAMQNSNAFDAAQDAMNNDPENWGHPLFIPSGKFYLARDLHISKSLELFGTGIQGESILVLPEIFQITPETLACLTTEGISNEIIEKIQSLLGQEFLDQELLEVVRKLLGEDAALTDQEQILILKCAFSRSTSLIVDPATNANPAQTGTECVIRDLQIHSSPMWTGADAATVDLTTLTGASTASPAILLQAPATLKNLLIRGFWGTGIYIFAGGDTNANQWRIHDVYINECGGHGIHVDGGETQGGLCTGAKIISIGGNGIYESSFGGNTYVGCYVEEARGRGYFADTAGQATFVGCAAEAREPSRILSGVFVGGNPGPLTEDTTALIAPDALNVNPFRIANDQGSKVTTFLGVKDNSNTVLGWETADEMEDQQARWFLTWRKVASVWETRRSISKSGIVPVQSNYLTGTGHDRGVGFQGFPALLLGPENGAIKITSAANVSPAVNDLAADRRFLGNWQLGDRIYDPALIPDKKEGWICVQAGDDQPDNSNTAIWKAFGTIE